MSCARWCQIRTVMDRTLTITWLPSRLSSHILASHWQRPRTADMNLEDDVLAMIRRGINTRHRLVMALNGREPAEVGNVVAALIYRGLVRTDGRRLVVA